MNTIFEGAKNTVQGVAKGVAGTASNVAGVATSAVTSVIPGRGKDTGNHATKEDRILDEAPPKMSIQIKGTPRKDERTTRMLSIKRGELIKRNDQGTWHNVVAYVVPHLFLYYYENRKDETPKGIIDLYLYDQTKVVGGEDAAHSNSSTRNSSSSNSCQGRGSFHSGPGSAPESVLELSPSALSDGTAPKDLRTFYFGANDAQTLHDWVSRASRERYENVRDERDAYQALQDNFNSELEDINRSITDTEASKEDLMQQLAASKTAHDDLLASLQRILTMFGTTEEDMQRVRSDGRKSSELCAQYYKRMLKEHEAALRVAEQKHEAEKEELEMRLTELTAALDRSHSEVLQAQLAAQEDISRDKEATDLLRLELQQAQFESKHPEFCSRHGKGH